MKPPSDCVTNYMGMGMQSIWQQLTGRKKYSYSSNVSLVLHCMLTPMNYVFSGWRYEVIHFLLVSLKGNLDCLGRCDLLDQLRTDRATFGRLPFEFF